MSKHLKQKLVVGFFWSFFGQAGYLLVSLVTNIILARILGPEVFGKIGIIMFFIVIAKVLSESGLGGALVRKKETSEEDYSTVFFFNLGISIILFLLIIISADSIASFYKDESLKKLLIVASSVLIINAFQIIQNVKLIRALNYKKKAKFELIAVSIASTIGIVSATKFNTGIWAVVAVQLLTAFIITVQYWLYGGLLKKWVFNIHSFKTMYKFGVNTTLASILDTAFDNIYQLILAKYFNVRQAGLYFQAKKLQEVPVGVIKNASQGVVFATLSKLQNDLKYFDQMYKRIIIVFTSIVGFICTIIFFYAENIINILYGSQWIDAVFYMQILVIASFFYMQEMFNRIIFKIFDRTEKILYLEILKKIIQSLTIIVGIIFLNIKILLFGFLLVSVFNYFLNYYQSRKVFGSFSWQEIILTIKVVVIAFVGIYICLLLINIFSLNGYSSFWLLPILGSIYFSLLYIFKVVNIISEMKTVLVLFKR